MRQGGMQPIMESNKGSNPSEPSSRKEIISLRNQKGGSSKPRSPKADPESPDENLSEGSRDAVEHEATDVQGVNQTIVVKRTLNVTVARGRRFLD